MHQNLIWEAHCHGSQGSSSWELIVTVYHHLIPAMVAGFFLVLSFQIVALTYATIFFKHLIIRKMIILSRGPTLFLRFL